MGISAQTDEQLVAASLQGSDRAFDDLVVRYRTRLLRFLLSRSASREDAEDAIQDTFISAHRYLYSFDPHWRFSTWLYRIALRSLERQRVRRDQQIESADDIVADSGDPLQECLDDSVRLNVWLTAKRVLTTEAYSAMWLRYVEDMPVKDVARTMEKSGSWAKVTLMRGRRKLEAEMSAERLLLDAGVSDAGVTAARNENYG
jgi:RNA polymerase sigma-70 factor (ECF subfamily)